MDLSLAMISFHQFPFLELSPHNKIYSSGAYKFHLACQQLKNPTQDQKNNEELSLVVVGILILSYSPDDATIQQIVDMMQFKIPTKAVKEVQRLQLCSQRTLNIDVCTVHI
ncbi:hypothetical protein Ancab_029399 [Ancistrocladus abbreviatus]